MDVDAQPGALEFEEYMDWDAIMADYGSASDASSSVSSASSTSRSGSPMLDQARVYTEQLSQEPTERDLCRDYTCCGLVLADLHELVCHFEEVHVVCASGTGQKCAEDPVTSTFGTIYVQTARDGLGVDAGAQAQRKRMRPGEKDEAPMICLSLRELERKPGAGQPNGQAPEKGATSSSLRRAQHWEHASHKILPPGVERKKYVCPREHCIKSYRNSSGLSYHLEKGSCKFVV